MNSSFLSNPIHPSKTAVDCPRQAAPSVIPFISCWHPLFWAHPLFWTAMTTLSTLTLLGAEAAIAQRANAQTAIVPSESLAAMVQAAQSNEPAGIVQLDALEALSESVSQSANQSADQATNQAGNQFVQPGQSFSQPIDQPADQPINPATATAGANDSTAAATDSWSNDADPDRSGEAENRPAIEISQELSLSRPDSENSLPSGLDASPAEQARPDSFDLDGQHIAARTENANFLNPSFEIQSSAEPQPNSSSVSPSVRASELVAQGGSALLGAPIVLLQGAVVVQGDEVSARARTTVSYAVSPNVLVGGTLDLVTGDAFADSPESGLNLNELYVAVSPSEIPTLRFVVGLLDYTSYFDRNSFAKDGVTHFFNPIFQTNPALAAAGLSSRPGVLVNWSVTDNLELRAAGFSSRRDLGDFALDGFAAEAAVRVQNLILRGTYVTAKDAGDDSGFREIFQFNRGNGNFGLRSGDREQAYGINAEYFVPSIRLGLFARYGWYDNLDLGRGGETYSFGLNLLDLFMADDRLGLAYGRDLSDEGLRQRRGDKQPDVLELFYDARLLPHLRAGITAQARDGFSETILGFRVRADFTLNDLGRIFR